MIYADLSATVGHTPLVELGRIARGLPGRVVGKLEMRNPLGSVKDRVAVALIDDAERRGVLRAGMTIVEATGGNTGIGLAFVAAIRGYRLVLTMPSTMSRERVALLRQLGADVVLTPGILMTDAVTRAEQLVREIPGAVGLDQFRNPANPEVHRRTTAIEIWDESDGAVDVLVSAFGTGGTFTGVGEVLKERKPSVRVVAVEPANAALLSGRPPGEHRIPGIKCGPCRAKNLQKESVQGVQVSRFGHGLTDADGSDAVADETTQVGVVNDESRRGGVASGLEPAVPAFASATALDLLPHRAHSRRFCCTIARRPSALLRTISGSTISWRCQPPRSSSQST